MSEIAERLVAALADRYRIERELGAGGMATVYLAHDLKHDRKVALKVLRPELAAVIGAERFLSEIKTTANLQHPHILPLFDSGSADSFLYYVMPYVEGETLRGKLQRERQLGVDESVRLIRDVADALDYAHRHGVIHRDIKPENILVHDGRPVVADFGIALAVSAAGKGRMTETGLSLGTPHYMSPEQATADRDLSARSDIYSLACVLYEMLAGDPPHTGPSPQAILMRILTDTPRLVSETRSTVPPHVVAALAKALEKLPADRFESAKAFGEALVTEGFTYSTRATMRGVQPVALPPAASGSRGGRRAAIAGWSVAVFAIVAAAYGWTRPTPTLPLTRLDLSTGAVTPADGSDVAVSPNGKMIAFGGTLGTEQAIFLRHLDGEADFRKVPGTETGMYPAFSPDNQWIVFRRVSDRSLVKVSVSGGGVTTIVPAGAIDPYMPHWGTANEIVFSGPTGLHRVAASGGAPVPLPKVGGTTPFLLPDGSGVLSGQGNNLSLYDFASDSAYLLVPNARHAVYVETGHLLYIAEDAGLFAVTADIGKRRVSGAPVRVLDRVAAAPLARGYSLSRNGVLVHHEGVGTGGIIGGTNRLLIIDPAGGTDTLRLPAARRQQPRFSPDGRSVAFETFSTVRNGETDLFTFDLVSGTHTQITFDGDNDRPIWSPDGKQILFNKSVTGSGEDLFVKPADNSGPERALLTQPANQQPSAWLQDGTITFFSGTGGSSDLFTMSVADSGKAKAYLTAPWNEIDLQVSSDGKLAAFAASESGGEEIWIRDFPVPQGKWKVSPHGGTAPRWAPDGRAVYFWRAGVPLDSLFRARIDRSPNVIVHAPEVVATLDASGIQNWDLHPDGKRFIVAVTEGAAPASATGAAAPVTDRYLVIQNWFSELKRLAPKP